jgi:hypothetical protein
MMINNVRELTVNEIDRIKIARSVNAFNYKNLYELA